LEVSYEKLPVQTRQPYRGKTGLGYVEFGTFDQSALSRVRWDEMHYDVENLREDQSSLQSSVMNRAHSLTSSEPLPDSDAESEIFVSDSKTSVPYGQRDFSIERVFQVQDKDGSTTYSFEDRGDHLVLTNGDEFPKKEHEVQLLFYAKRPYSKEYIKNQQPTTRLYEDVPYFPESQRADFTVEEKWATRFNDEEDVFNSDEDVHFSDQTLRVEYELDSEQCPLFKDLDVISKEDDGEEGLLSPAYDQETFRAFDIGLREDQYTFPDIKDPGLGTNVYPLTLDDASSLLDNESYLLDPSLDNESEVRGEVVDTRTENYSGYDDDFQSGTMRDFDGAVLLDSEDYHLDALPGDDEYGELDTYSSSDTNIDLNSTVNYP
jgi:hypothetical protein